MPWLWIVAALVVRLGSLEADSLPRTSSLTTSVEALAMGERMSAPAAPTSVVRSIVRRPAERVVVHNLKIGQTQSYSVGAPGVLVHNTSSNSLDSWKRFDRLVGRKLDVAGQLKATQRALDAAEREFGELIGAKNPGLSTLRPLLESRAAILRQAELFSRLRTLSEWRDYLRQELTRQDGLISDFPLGL